MPTPKIWKVGDNFMSRAFFRFHSFFNAITVHYLQKLPTLLTVLLLDVKSGRFMYQSGRARDEAKKRKFPAKSGRVGISEKDQWQLSNRVYQPLIVLSRACPGKLLVWQSISTIQVVKSGFTWPLDRSQQNVSRQEKWRENLIKIDQIYFDDYCRICRSNLKISWSLKINIFGSKRDNQEFLKAFFGKSLILLSEKNNATGLSQIVC